MKAKQISVGRTFNTGNYTSERYDVTLELEENDSVLVCSEYAHDLLQDMYNVHWGVSGAVEKVPLGEVRKSTVNSTEKPAPIGHELDPYGEKDIPF